MEDPYEIIASSQHASSQSYGASACIATDEVVDRIEGFVASVVELMNGGKLPSTRSLGEKSLKRFTLAQSRSFTSILMVLSYCHSLLGHNRSATTREVYYFFVTHFRNQRECDSAIWEAADLLGVPRMSLGLAASPKGRKGNICRLCRITIAFNSQSRCEIAVSCRLVLRIPRNHPQWKCDRCTSLVVHSRPSNHTGMVRLGTTV